MSSRVASDAALGPGVVRVLSMVDIGATLAAWRERGDHRFDPVRFCVIEAMARRAAAHGGAARRVLDEKLLGLMSAYGDALGKASPADGKDASGAALRSAQPGVATPSLAPRNAAALPPTGPLAELVDHIAGHASTHRHGASASHVVPASFAPVSFAPASFAPRELKSLEYFRSTWSRLSTQRRLTQSLAKVPDKAGPLNSHHLVHRALSTMRELSPAYLEHFMTHVDALLWLDQVNSASSASAGAVATGAAPATATGVAPAVAAAVSKAPRAEKARKAPRGK